MLFNSLRIYFRSGFCINFRFIYKNFRGEENKKEGSISFLLLKCSPEEELRKEQRRKNDKLVIDIARSDLYLVGLDFSYVDPTKIDPLTGKPDLKPQ
jgi:hypothetical protein